MAIEPKNTREHILALYGYLTGVKRDISQIKNNHLKHMHADIDKLGGKVDKIYWVLLATVGTVALFFLDKLLS
jgi:hypothetical protein|tara:strand:- start:243 stop:461 length:219 start_codon:yes stop_codon:yes gene_type:complete